MVTSSSAVDGFTRFLEGNRKFIHHVRKFQERHEAEHSGTHSSSSPQLAFIDNPLNSLSPPPDPPMDN